MPETPIIIDYLLQFRSIAFHSIEWHGAWCMAYSPVEARASFLPPNRVQRLEEGVVLAALLAQARARHLVRVRDARGHRLGDGAGQHELQEIAGGFRITFALILLFDLRPPSTQQQRQQQQDEEDE